MLNYYRRFIRQAAHILAPLVKFLKGIRNKKRPKRNVKIKPEEVLQWTDEATTAFELISAPPSSDPSDVRAFTPGYFLIGVPLLDLPDGASSTNLRLPFRWNWLQQIKQVFWKRCGSEIIYITYKAGPKDILKELIYKLEIGW
ncbi:transposon Tf2-6 polyprotein [Trichonephila inaurata madagascariensis]|uniref:Transposon Tf2-6 polyprotein n=1 Tax=Trichonephila inaurata madagascariensis TaxID=2747483 RepID=A0A8X6YJI0_9ARAC|nr:transposon Tf2-6 polyprotein [Trichonephila inaurata madagascariensis]